MSISYSVKEWIERYTLGGYTPEEIVSILTVEHGLDEYQSEDLAMYMEKQYGRHLH